MKLRIECPNCGAENATFEMWGRVNPATTKYVRRLLGLRIDTLLLSMAMVAMGVVYVVFYVVALPIYGVWRLFTFKQYSVRRYEYVCEECGYEWEQDEGEPAPLPTISG